MKFVSTWNLGAAGTASTAGYTRATIEAPTWVMARDFMKILHPGAVTVQAVEDDAEATLELRETGDDYAKGGTLDGLRREVRVKDEKGWGPWERA